MNVYTIYLVTNDITSKKYVGFTGNTLCKRKKQHLYSFKSGKKTKFYDAIRKYGIENFDWKIIYQSKDKLHCKEIMESYFIKEYDTYFNGYNMTMGGDGVDIGTKPWNKNLLNDIRLKWDEKRKTNHSKKLKQMWNDQKKNELSTKWNNEKRKNHSITLKKSWNKKIQSGYKVISNNILIECPHCKKINNVGNAKRWHFDKCKMKGII